MSLPSFWSFLRFAVLIPAKAVIERCRYPALARSATLQVRGYRPGDERAIIHLFHLTFRREKSMDHWQWEFLRNPSGVVNIALLDSDTAGLAGQYAGVAVPFQCPGRLVSAAQNVDVMLHPALRRADWFARLGREYIKLSRRNGVQLLYGFNENVMARVHRRVFGATLVPVSEWACDVPRQTAGMTDDRAVGETEEFDARVDTLWERIRGPYRYAVVRDRRYLTWRYVQRPGRRYAFRLAVDSSAADIAGLAVLGVHGSDGLILELLAHPDDRDVITALLRASVRYFGRTGRRRVRAWIPGHGQLQDCARMAGFGARQSGFFLNLLPLDDAMDIASLKAEFYYSLGDYDVH